MKQFKVNFIREGCFYVNADHFNVNDDTIVFFSDNGEEMNEILVPKLDVTIELVPANNKVEERIEKNCD